MNQFIKIHLFPVFLGGIALGLFLISPAETYAQTTFGIRGGLSYSGMKYRPIPSLPSQKISGIKGTEIYGVVIEHFFKDHAGAQIEAQYLTTGYQEYNEQGDRNETQFDYLKIPLLANFYFGNTGRFHIKMGTHIGKLIDARDTHREFETENEEIPIMPTYGQPSDDPKKLMYGLTAGLGLSKVFGKSTFQAEARASYEFGRPEGQDRIFDMTTTNLEFTLSYHFQILKRKE
ncbi:porin family protein [Echinicola jeungdonensis]|uniref:Porin family protein n=1 Tax=Echinicola jeungdonensis TaxID=709343 RepID=A0ABV5J3B4_9BACT|nr:porin family protein [Echinicola jeungdonensis]MDN3668957.1 porin family protein [Echinicola jeungdonensis]